MQPAKSEIGLIGNPNCGKTSLFNQLTGSRQSVGNWPGVTVARKSGELRLDSGSVTLVDLPGLYSLNEGGGEDEAVARQYLSQTPPGLVLNLIDARQLERQLYLTLQLIELGLPLVVLLGMSDLARRAGLLIDSQALAARLGVPVLEVVANRAAGTRDLRRMLDDSWPGACPVLSYDPLIEQAVAPLVEAGLSRSDALASLEGDELVHAPAELVERQREQLAAEYGDDPDIAIADGRYTRIAELLHEVCQPVAPVVNQLDRLVLNRWLGGPIFLLVMYAMFSWSVNVGGAFIDVFDGVAGVLFVDLPAQLLGSWQAPDWLSFALANGLGEGVRTVATFIPTLGFLYLALGVLEDSGYMARAAFVIDRLMRGLGLPGRAFVPLIVGFGCNVPAILATRTLESRASRILASMMIPFTSCGARLPVYLLFATAFFPEQGGSLVMSLYLAGLVLALATGLLLRPLLLRGVQPAAILELPAWHRPNLLNVWRQTWQRLSGFILGAGKLIVPMVLLLNLLSAINPQLQFTPDAPEQSLLANSARAVTPAFAPLGIQPDNWPATVGLITGVLAKEAVAGTLLSSYARLSGAQADTEQSTLGESLAAALQTVPDNLALLGERITDPLGLDSAERDARAAAAADAPAFAELRARFGTAEVAYAYLLFVLLYTPCVAALGALKAELGSRWMLFSAGWTLLAAYSLAWAYRALAPLLPSVPLLPISALLAAMLAIGLLRRSKHPALIPLQLIPLKEISDAAA